MLKNKTIIKDFNDNKVDTYNLYKDTIFYLRTLILEKQFTEYYLSKYQEYIDKATKFFEKMYDKYQCKDTIDYDTFLLIISSYNTKLDDFVNFLKKNKIKY